ncbi:MAG: class I SAM-dependent methyltransferase [Actinobacteria bacterium]|nr:class I SAM-dependent methyltransferase [Actinomycetota bacterium]
MIVSPDTSTAIWQDPDYARYWTSRDRVDDMLTLPRQLASALVASDRPQTAVVLDIASGPGAFLGHFLDAFPAAKGIWTDASPTMMETARERLARFGDRVDFILADMNHLADADLPSGVDVVTSSRASHHLNPVALVAFYRAASAHITPGGWLINLDHIFPGEPWNRRLRQIRNQFWVKASQEGGAKHYHNYPLPSIDDHLRGFEAAGISEVDTPWRAFYSCLMVGRVPD